MFIPISLYVAVVIATIMLVFLDFEGRARNATPFSLIALHNSNIFVFILITQFNEQYPFIIQTICFMLFKNMYPLKYSLLKTKQIFLLQFCILYFQFYVFYLKYRIIRILEEALYK